MSYNKPMFTVERPNLASTIQQQQPKRLPRGASPGSGRFASLLSEPTETSNVALPGNASGKSAGTTMADSIAHALGNTLGNAAGNANPPVSALQKPADSRALLETIQARRNPVVEEMTQEATAYRNNAQALSTFAKIMQESPTPLKTLDKLLSNPEMAAQMGLGEGGEAAALKNSPFMSSFQKLFRDIKTEQSEMSIRTSNHRRKTGKVATISDALSDMFKEKTAFSRQGENFIEQLRKSGKSGLGMLAAQFESGRDGIAAIGYDRGGGTSYGKYQIASRVGSMDAFIDYLERAAPDIAKKLNAAGPSNTGGRTGKMPAVWKQIAAAEPQRFEDLQEQFIQASHYIPALGAISKATGIDPGDMPAAMHEVIFSTAVQHGPGGASRIFSRAFNQAGESFEKQVQAGVNVGTSKALGEALIKRVYNIRSNQFAASSASVRGAVQNRLKTEMNMALTMLRENIA